jgi:hypothetical protein
MYDLFRSTAHHSTVMIDGSEQNRFIPGKFFCLHPDGQPRVLKWEPESKLDRVSAEFDGYRRLSDPIRHRRDVSVRRPDSSVLVEDHFSGRVGCSDLHCFEMDLDLCSGLSGCPDRGGLGYRHPSAGRTADEPCPEA